MSRFLTRFHNNVRGATAIEYCLIAGSIALVVIAAVNTLGNSVKVNFFDQAAKITTPSS